MFLVEAAAGKGREVAEYYDVTQIPILERFIYPYKANQVKAVIVKGDSMNGMHICHNDIVLFVPEEKGCNGIFVISINNNVLVKRLEFNPAEHCVRVLSENEKYAPIVIKENGGDILTVSGRVIVVLHRAM
ncbi:S24 family peptidase [Treponema parvum]|uniref:S24 family peptidase n=1 Tax=Treponema parvum TaxID=138851 RepID=A0A975IEE4_9SPIR|nr:S24 family peptidase [Treponema parvum]QTQ13798.1 S24 family peptidase [Treponema parvum]